MHMNPCSQNLIKENRVNRPSLCAGPENAAQRFGLSPLLHLEQPGGWQEPLHSREWAGGDGAQRRCKAALRGWAASTSPHQCQQRRCYCVSAGCSQTTQSSTAFPDVTTDISTHCNHILKPKADVERVPFKEVYGILSTNERSLFHKFAAILPSQSSSRDISTKKPSTKSMILLF